MKFWTGFSTVARAKRLERKVSDLQAEIAELRTELNRLKQRQRLHAEETEKLGTALVEQIGTLRRP